MAIVCCLWLTHISFLGLYRHRRTAATHVLAVLISPEGRDRKPYAIPVQLIPYTGLPQAKIRDVISNVVKEMSIRGMNISGMCNLHTCKSYCMNIGACVRVCIYVMYVYTMCVCVFTLI